MSTGGSRLRRNDPIVRRKTPLLFAHRGGAGEVPESTEEAFRHAVKHGADVLEVDVRLTCDGEIVVWHGPGLEKVRGKKRTYAKRDCIGKFCWRELRDKVWVLHPTDEPKFIATPRRRLLLLSDFFKLVDKLERQLAKSRTLHVNIEFKKRSGPAPGWTTEYLEKLLDLVCDQPKRRTIILASLGRRRLKALRQRMARRGVRHPTNLAFSEQLAYSNYMKRHPLGLGLGVGDLFVREKKTLENHAFETSHALAGKKLVRKVRKDDGSLYVFLTSIKGAPGIDDQEPEDLEQPLFDLLEAGVDGVMTDYPDKVGALLRKWKRNTG